MAENTTLTPKQPTVAGLNFMPASILLETRSDKFESDVVTSFLISTTEDPFKAKVKWSTMLEMAELADNETFSILLRNGYKGSQNFSSGAGIAVRADRKDDVYELTFFEGEQGKPFDVNAIQGKHYLSVNRQHLDAIFTFIRFNSEAEEAKAAALKLQRTTLDLG